MAPLAPGFPSASLTVRRILPLRPAISSDQTLRLYRGGIRVPDRVGRRRDVDLPVLHRVAVSRHSGSRSACALMFGFRRRTVRIRDYGTESSIGPGIWSTCAVEPLLSVHGPVPSTSLNGVLAVWSWARAALSLSRKDGRRSSGFASIGGSRACTRPLNCVSMRRAVLADQAGAAVRFFRFVGVLLRARRDFDLRTLAMYR
jgi:hypothetical protein